MKGEKYYVVNEVFNDIKKATEKKERIRNNDKVIKEALKMMRERINGEYQRERYEIIEKIKKEYQFLEE